MSRFAGIPEVSGRLTFGEPGLYGLPEEATFQAYLGKGEVNKEHVRQPESRRTCKRDAADRLGTAERDAVEELESGVDLSVAGVGKLFDFYLMQ
jgi:hypothetical protein